MCGINGIVDLQPRGPLDGVRAIEAMNDAIAHRGPDGDGCFVGPGVALGHRRLAILDLSPAGAQPMASACGRYVLVFNGEIYNYRELAAELAARGRPMRSRSDSEVLLQAYAEWGEDCLQRFNGMWAFAIWDRIRRRLFAARDRLGVKPLVLAERAGRLWFSSELSGLRAVLPLDEADPVKLHDYLAWGYRRNDGRAWLAGARELLPGHALVVQDGCLREWRWWTLPGRDAAAPVRDADERLRELLADAVRLRLRSDVPVALLQSGGLDSAVIATLVEREAAAGRAGPVAAYTAVHPGHRWDESGAVAELMRRTPHLRPVALQPPGDELDVELPRYVDALREPQASASSFAHWSLMRAVREQGVKVVLNGQGADEAFAGYGSLIAGYRLLDTLVERPAAARAEAFALARTLGLGGGALLAQTAKALLGRRAASAWRGWISEGGCRVLQPGFARPVSTLPEVGASLSGGNLDRHLRSQLLHYGFNQILAYEDLSAMSQGVEVRSPFVDWRVVEFAFSLPDDERFAEGRTKRILRRAFGAVLPPRIAAPGPKIGFATPFDEWARRPRFRAFVQDLVASREFRDSPVWQSQRLAKWLTGPESAPRGFPAWRFIVAALWLRGLSVAVA